jgi:hypothetical protein
VYPDILQDFLISRINPTPLENHKLAIKTEFEKVSADYVEVL